MTRVKLDHLNLTVSDPPAAAAFLTGCCGMRLVDDSNRNFIFLTDDNGMVLALMKGKDAIYPASFHIGFIQPTRAAVDAINARMRADGHDVPLPAEHHARTFFARVPGGPTVEILCQGRPRPAQT